MYVYTYAQPVNYEADLSLAVLKQIPVFLLPSPSSVSLVVVGGLLASMSARTSTVLPRPISSARIPPSGGGGGQYRLSVSLHHEERNMASVPLSTTGPQS